MSSPSGLSFYGIAACLTITGRDLDPSLITQWLGISPKNSHQRGDTILTPYERKEVIAEEGIWCYEGPMCEQALDVAIDNVFNQLPSDQGTWDQVAINNNIELTCVFFLETYALLDCSITLNQLQLLSQRHISLSLKGMKRTKPIDE